MICHSYAKIIEKEWKNRKTSLADARVLKITNDTGKNRKISKIYLNNELKGILVLYRRPLAASQRGAAAFISLLLILLILLDLCSVFVDLFFSFFLLMIGRSSISLFFNDFIIFWGCVKLTSLAWRSMCWWWVGERVSKGVLGRGVPALGLHFDNVFHIVFVNVS